MNKKLEGAKEFAEFLDMGIDKTIRLMKRDNHRSRREIQIITKDLETTRLYIKKALETFAIILDAEEERKNE